MQRKIGKDQENELYELIGQQDKRLAAAYVQYKDTGRVYMYAIIVSAMYLVTHTRTHARTHAHTHTHTQHNTHTQHMRTHTVTNTAHTHTHTHLTHALGV